MALLCPFQSIDSNIELSTGVYLFFFGILDGKLNQFLTVLHVFYDMNFLISISPQQRPAGLEIGIACENIAPMKIYCVASGC